ncbi:inositol monophosphatase family protein [Salinactinospora qingdaonensis]|uniref:Inositol-1-monophosphatase n=1 Tax=Salinactinospora qingdaonensis TaxID=702744 RepID=A0ABP7F467_9ACTN
MAMADPHELLELAIDVVEKAGRLAAEGQAKVDVLDTKSSPTDVVTEMDRATEDLIRTRLLTARPSDALLGEEGGAARGTTGVRWIVDPIDGTVNYLYGRPDWAVSIAAEADGEIVAGAVAAPVHGETYTATRGGGARCDGVELRAGEAVPLEMALVATGFGYEAQRRSQQAEVLRAVLPRVRDIRRCGSAALDLCSLAKGRANAYYERGLNQWDWAAAALVAAEAGVHVAGLHGRAPNSDLTVAAVPGLFEELHDLLAALGADADG